MKVYVAMTGLYSDTWVGGVFASPEIAMAMYSEPCRDLACGHEWSERERTWLRACDWDSHVEIQEMELIESVSQEAVSDD